MFPHASRMSEAAFHVVGSLLSIAAIAWAVRESRAFATRWPLAMPSTRHFVISVACGVALLVAPVLAIVPIAMTLPKSPANFIGMMSYATIVGLAAIFAVLARLQSHWAVGWIEPIDERSFSLRTDGRTQVVTLAPGDVQAFMLGDPNNLQLLIRHGEDTLHLVVPAGVRAARLAREGIVMDPPRGLRITAGARRFLRSVEPFIDRDGST
jgi:hypothetical protein